MSDEVKNPKSAINFFDILNQTKQTFEEAEAQIKAESFSQKVDRFRMGDNGEYSVRILPLVPNLDANGNILPMERHGFEYAVHQQFLKIALPKKKGDKKAKEISIPVINATDKGVGYSVDLIDTYVKIAKELYPDDEELMKLIDNTNYYGGLKWGYLHAMYVLDLTGGGRKGPLLWQATHSQYCDIRDAKQRLWVKERQKNPDRDCPVCGFKDAYPVTIIRGIGNNKQTEYTVEIDRYTDDLTEADLSKLFDLPRIPEQIYRYSRYIMEATIVALQQYDEKHDMEVCKEQDFLDAVEKLKGELPADDKSHFDINKSAEDKSDKGGKEEVTVKSLWAELDRIEDAGLSEKSDEYQELREKIRQFVEDKELDVRLTRSKSNQKLIEEIEDALDDLENRAPAKKDDDEDEKSSDKKGDEPEEREEPEERPARTRRSRRSEEEEQPEEPKNDGEPEEQPEEEAPRRTRRARPGSKADEEEREAEAEAEKKEDEPEPEEEEERPRLHSRRRR